MGSAASFVLGTETLGLPRGPAMSETAEFIARENIRRFKAQLQGAAEGTRKTTILELLAIEERLLRDLVAGKE